MVESDHINGAKTYSPNVEETPEKAKDAAAEDDEVCISAFNNRVDNVNLFCDNRCLRWNALHLKIAD